MELPVYNLQFRPRSTSICVAGYTFRRIPNYADAQGKLQYLVNSQGAEFSTKVQTGSIVHTGIVSLPIDEPLPVVSWQRPNATALDDIVLLLKLFTLRDVFVLKTQDFPVDEVVINADARCFPWGGILKCSVPYESRNSDRPYAQIDTSLEVHLPQIYARMSDPNWKREYGNGYFLVLLGYAIQQRSLEAAFTQCWTIWEHLFSCLTDKWLSDNAIRNLSSKEKIAFLLVKFGVRENLVEKEKARLAALVEIRNRLIHFGVFPEKDIVRDDAIMFIRMTEFIAAKSLGLFPSNLFNTVEQLEEFLGDTAGRGVYFRSSN